MAIVLVLLSMSAWYPVVLWLSRGESNENMGARGETQVQEHARLEGKHETSYEEFLAHVHIFHEPGCIGESIIISRPTDLCDRQFASGAEAKVRVSLRVRV